MITIHECEILQEFGMGLCPHCHSYKTTFEVLIPIFDRPDEIVEGCRRCVEIISEQVSNLNVPNYHSVALISDARTRNTSMAS